MREKIKHFTQHKYFPLLCYAVIITAFSLFLTRYFIKMDDGNFLGIVSAPDFTYRGWLTERYNTLSGRTFGELLLAFFIRRDVTLWKLANSAILVYISFIWFRVAEAFDGEISLRRRQIFCCCAMFMMMVSCLNPSVFWFAGSFTYLWPFFGLVVTVVPILFYSLGIKVSKFETVLSVPAVLIATAQEQSAAAVTALYVILLAVLIVKKMKLRFSFLVPLPVLAVCDFHLFSSPGAAARSVMEAQSGFVRYTEMGLLEKLGCGLAVFFANSFYLSNFLILLFIGLLCVALYSVAVNKKRCKRLLMAVWIYAAVVCVAVNYSVSLVKRGLPHMFFRSQILKGEYDLSFYVLFSLGCLLLVIIAALSVWLLIKNKKLGFFVAVCLAAGFGCAMAMSFSSSVFASGQRVFFFTNVFVLSACVALLSSLQRTKTADRLYLAAVIYAVAFFAVDCVAFRVIEMPLMG